MHCIVHLFATGKLKVFNPVPSLSPRPFMPPNVEVALHNVVMLELFIMCLHSTLARLLKLFVLPHKVLQIFNKSKFTLKLNDSETKKKKKKKIHTLVISINLNCETSVSDNRWS